MLNRSPALKAAVKAERELSQLKRQLQQLDIDDAPRREPLAEVPRGGKPVDLDVLRRQPDRLKKPQLPTGNRAGTVSGFQMRHETSLRRFAPQLMPKTL